MKTKIYIPRQSLLSFYDRYDYLVIDRITGEYYGIDKENIKE